MIRLFTAVQCPPGGSGWQTVQKQEGDSCFTQKDRQYTKELKNTESTEWETKNTTQNKHERNTEQYKSDDQKIAKRSKY